MPTTTIRLPEDLNARIANLAKHAGTSPHALILSAITEKVEQAERQNGFEDVAERRFAQIVQTGETISWAEMQSYLNRRVADLRSEFDNTSGIP